MRGLATSSLRLRLRCRPLPLRKAAVTRGPCPRGQLGASAESRLHKTIGTAPSATKRDRVAARRRRDARLGPRPDRSGRDPACSRARYARRAGGMTAANGEDVSVAGKVYRTFRCRRSAFFNRRSRKTPWGLG